MKVIDDNKDSLAVILLPGLHYYTGQWFDVERLTKHAHQYGILVGVDCAHAIGNKELKLKEWDVDFAAWCTYKCVYQSYQFPWLEFHYSLLASMPFRYLCSGAGGIGCIYVNERFTKTANDQCPMLRGT